MQRFLAALSAAVLAACGPASTPQPAQPAASSSNWDAQLTEMLPYIDACLVRSPNTRWISYAGRTGDASVTVRLSGESEVDCTAPLGAPNQAQIVPRGAPIDGEDAAIFVRAPGENPGGECYEAPEVRNANGELLGWMADPAGC